MPEELILIAPTGALIRGTLETLQGVAEIRHFFHDENGLNWEYAGHTDILWNEQRTVKRNGMPVLVDENDDLWTESECTWVPKGTTRD